MKIQQVMVNPSDSKAKTEIEGTLQGILPNEQGTLSVQTEWGIKQTVIFDGVNATFWAGKTPLALTDVNKPMKLLCNARIYNNLMQYSLSRPRPAGSGGGRYANRDYDKELRQKNLSVGLSYALDKDLLGLPYGVDAYKKAMEMAEFMETGKFPLSMQTQALGNRRIPEPDPDIQESPPDDDDIPPDTRQYSSPNDGIPF